MKDQPPRTAESPGAPRPSKAGATWIAALLLALVPVLLFSESLFGGKVLSQVDALLEFQPWRSAAPLAPEEGAEGHGTEGRWENGSYRPGNPLLLDQSLLMWPWLDYSTERIRAGELPLWNPYNFCGQPITAAVTGATYWPLHLAHYAYPTPAYHGWAAALRVFLAGLFTWLFLRRLGISSAGGLVGAVTFMCGGFMIAWLNHPHTNAAMCLPLLLWGIERLAARQNARCVAWLALSVALPLLGGHLQTATHVLLVAGAYAMYRAAFGIENSQAMGWRGLVRFAVAGILGCVLAAPQWLPFVEYYKTSLAKDLFAAFDTASEFPRAVALQLMLAPDSLGGPHTGDWRGPSGFNLNYNELIGGYVGRLPLLLAAGCALVLKRRRAAWFFAGLALVAALIAWRVPPFYGIARSIPLLGSTKLMRFLLLVSFALAVLAAHGLDALLERCSRSRALLVAGLALVVSAADLIAWGRGYNPAIERELIAPKSGLTDFLARDDGLYRVLGVDNRILLPNANLFHRIPMVSGYDSIEYRPTAELVSRLTRDPWAGFDEILRGSERPDTGFIKEIRWFDRPEGMPLMSLLGVKYLVSEFELPAPLELVYEDQRADPATRLRAYVNPQVSPRAFVARGWKVIEDRDARLRHMAAADFDPRVAVLEERAPQGFQGTPVADEPPGRVEITRYQPRQVELEIEMESPGLIVLADAWDPGWSAREGDREIPIARVDHALRGMFLDAGRHQVELRYDPASTRSGLWLGGIALLACCVLVLRPSRPDSRN